MAAIHPGHAENNYENLRLCSDQYQTLSVAIPSRASAIIRAGQGPGSKLSGFRFAVKSSSFIGCEEPTEAVDYQVPFNPRGDGYQSPAGSSSGSAAGLASYGWLDFTIGSDTTGSGRRLALVNGLFALRLSEGRLPLDGMVPTFDRFDTQCIFGRDINRLDDVVQVWFDGSDLAKPKPNAKSHPENIDAESLESYLDEVGHCSNSVIDADARYVSTRTFLYDFYHSFDEFRDKYRREFQKEPYANEYTQWRWDTAKPITEEENKNAMAQLDAKIRYMMLPVSEVTPNYRGRKTEPPSKQNAFEALYISPTIEAPEIVIPIAEFLYTSQVCGRKEKLPIAISVVENPGTDLALVCLIRDFLQGSDKPMRVSIGSSMFDNITS
ncbi:amidase signature enzyme [Melanomma pulvis-pyrius CBS 109.77]|uniref:Amidase signature enzyme n=1 Tax=Melanomma pulvis-pyrius CBS 109.77 TaxID=1314802 RepID=A0A6A6WT47_9PLEO|nr:amidase signature enzyme [Melanomma pulvis-pyrius CBS 109.77]